MQTKENTLNRGPILQTRGLTRYFGGLAAVSKVDFEVKEGDILGIIGPNGAGKTTLFNLISGALSPTRGTIQFMGNNITKSDSAKRCKSGIGRTFQKGRLFTNLSVFENILLAVLFGRVGHIGMNEARSEASKFLEFSDLKLFENHIAKDLTVAMQRRVEIARALATSPRLILLDEVLAGLTPTEVQEGTKLIRNIKSLGVTILMIEHIMRAIMGVSDRVLVLHHGEKILEGTPSEIECSEMVCEIYFGEKNVC